MRNCLLSLFVVIVGSTLLPPAPAEDATVNTLVGTWKLVSAKYGGEQSMLSKDSTTLTHFTPAHFMWASYGAVDKVTRTGGGPYTFKGRISEVTPAYGMGTDFDVVNAKRQTYECKVEGKRLYQSGTLSIGTTLEEVWELVEKK